MKNLIVFAMTLLLGACMPSLDPYFYLSLTGNPDIKVKRVARPDNPNIVSPEDMPYAYSLERPGYKLRLEASTADYWPSILVSAISGAGADLVIEPMGQGACGSFENLGKSYEIDGNSAIKYVWSPSFHKACKVDGVAAYKPEQSIRFKVTGGDGSVLGTESLAFELVRNGSYRSMDAI